MMMMMVVVVVVMMMTTTTTTTTTTMMVMMKGLSSQLIKDFVFKHLSPVCSQDVATQQGLRHGVVL